MKRFYYNLLWNARIKSISLGIVGIMLNALIIYLATTGIIKNLFVAVSLSVLTIGIIWLLARVPTGQSIEITDSSNLSLYYQLGPFKLWVKPLAGPVSIIIEQDKDRYYILKLTAPGHEVILERCPTLAEISKYNDYFKGMLTE